MAKYMLVETISMFKMAYLVETSNEEWAKDSVTCLKDGDEEIKQEHLDEIIVSVRPVKKKEALKLADDPNLLDQLTIKVPESAALERILARAKQIHWD